MTSSSQRKRLAGLDLLRLLAVMLVLGRHLDVHLPAAWPATLTAALLTWERGGWVGVDLFFVLSGFLVSGLLFSEYRSRGTLSVGRFYWRRGWKIYPPFLVLIATTIVLAALLGQPLPMARLWPELLFLQSYFRGIWDHTWSLAVEEHFYLLLPLVLTLVVRRGPATGTVVRRVLMIAGAVVAGSLLLRLLNWQLRPRYTHLTHLFASHLRFDSMFVGVAISCVYQFHTDLVVARLTPRKGWLAFIGAALLALPFLYQLESTPWVYTVGLTLFAAGSGMILLAVLLSGPPRGRLATWGAAVGSYSYSIYLWHLPVKWWVPAFIEWAYHVELGSGARLAIYFVGSILFGVIMSKAVELPALALRDRWFPPRDPGAVTGNTPPPPASGASAPATS